MDPDPNKAKEPQDPNPISGKPDDAPGASGGKKPDDAPGGNGGPPKEFTKDDVEAIVKDRLDRANKKRDADAEVERKRRDEEALAKNAEFEKLATQRGTELETIKPQLDKLAADIESEKTRREASEAALKKFVDQRIQELGLSDAVKGLLADKSPVDQMNWLSSNANEFEKPKHRSVPPTPPADGGSGNVPKDQIEEGARRYRSKF